MTEANKLDEPLSDADYDELEVFLGSNAVPQDCMDLEMLDGFLTAVVSGPELIQPSEWLPVVWSDSQRTVTPVFQNNEQAERILSLQTTGSHSEGWISSGPLTTAVRKPSSISRSMQSCGTALEPKNASRSSYSLSESGSSSLLGSAMSIGGEGN